MWRSQFDGSVGKVYHGLRAALPEIPGEVFGPRFGLMWMMAVNGLADRERMGEVAQNSVAFAEPTLFVQNLVDSLCGLLSAPVSAQTLAEVDKQRTQAARRA
jgi:hypothetical protein